MLLTALSAVQDSLFVLEVVADEAGSYRKGEEYDFVRTLRLVSRISAPMHRILPSATREPSELCQRITRETLDLKLSCCAFEGHVER